jgi:hypothetical protein
VNSEEIGIVGSPRSMRTFGPLILPHLRSSGRMYKVGQSEPLDLIQESRRPLDRVKMLEFSLCSMRRKDGSRPLDLGPITRQSSDRTGAVRGLPSGVQPSAYRDSQGQENRDTSSLEMPGRSEPPVEDTRGGDRGYYRESGYRHSRGQEIGEVRSKNPGQNLSRPFRETGVRNP